MNSKRKIESCRQVKTDSADLSTISDAAEGLGVKIRVSVCGDTEALEKFDEALGKTQDDEEDDD